MTKSFRFQSARVVLLAGLLVSVLTMSAVAAEAAGSTTGRLFQWRPFLAPFHSVVLHFPIGFLTIAGLLEVYRVFRPSEEIRRVTGLILWLGLATGVISVAFGLMRAGNGEY